MRGQVRDLRAHPFALAFRSAARRVTVEVEFVAVDVGHLGEPLAERIEPDDVRVHFAQPHRHRVDLVLQLLLQVRDLLLLLDQGMAEGHRLRQHRLAVVTAPEGEAEGERAAEDRERRQREHPEGERVRQVHLAGSALAT